jgi:predicted amidohydrolase YtcJ
MREGVVLGAGSDSPVSGFEPLLGIYAAVTRRAANGSLIAPEETISPDSALAMYTSNAACSSYADSFSGSIEVGKKADFVVLNADPTRCEAEMIREIRVEATILEGKVAYEA